MDDSGRTGQTGIGERSEGVVFNKENKFFKTSSSKYNNLFDGRYPLRKHLKDAIEICKNKDNVIMAFENPIYNKISINEDGKIIEESLTSYKYFVFPTFTDY